MQLPQGGVEKGFINIKRCVDEKQVTKSGIDTGFNTVPDIIKQTDNLLS